MYRFLPGPVVGVIVLLAISINTVLWAIPLYLFIVLKLAVPTRGARDAVQRLLIRMAECWIGVNNVILAAGQPTVWDLRGDEMLRLDGHYIVGANHQSWSDVLVLQRAFNQKIPFLKFFIKQELIWVPVLGLAWWGLDFPFMKRYSKEFLEKHPELRGKDLETTRKLCERIKGMPVSVMNFLEGTRFSSGKRDAQDSPYEHLLRPKAGGLAYVIAAMGESMDSMVDVTVVYVGGKRSLWDFVCGRVPRIVVHVQERRLPDDFIGGDYSGDETFRTRIQDWVTAIWAEKDDLIAKIEAEFAETAHAGG